MRHFEVGDKVRIKGSLDSKVFVISDISEDREGNEMITEMYEYENEDEYSDVSWYPEELELYEDKCGTKLHFPPFKSYGITVDQTNEVVENFINWQRRHLAQMLNEAIEDGDGAMINGYIEDLKIVNDFRNRFESFMYRLNDISKG